MAWLHTGAKMGIRTWSVLHCSIYAWNLTPNRHIPWSHSFRVLWRIDSRERLHHIVHTLHRNCYLHHSMDELRQIEISSKLSSGMQTTRFSSSSKPNVIYCGGVNYCWWLSCFSETTHNDDPFIAAAAAAAVIPANVDVKKGILHSNHVPVSLLFLSSSSVMELFFPTFM